MRGQVRILNALRQTQIEQQGQMDAGFGEMRSRFDAADARFGVVELGITTILQRLDGRTREGGAPA